MPQRLSEKGHSPLSGHLSFSKLSPGKAHSHWEGPLTQPTRSMLISSDVQTQNVCNQILVGTQWSKQVHTSVNTHVREPEV